MALPKKITELSNVFSSLPGIGPKLSGRLALYLATKGKPTASSLRQLLEEVATEIQLCERCNNVSNEALCEICSDDSRTQSTIFIVEDALDLYNIENTAEYKGLYHVTGGLISPVNGIGPEELFVESLFKRVRHTEPSEIILGLNPTVEGDSTSLYIKHEIEAINPSIRISRLAKGIPVGSDIEFMSSQTLIDSMKARNSF